MQVYIIKHLGMQTILQIFVKLFNRQATFTPQPFQTDLEVFEAQQWT